MLANRQELYAVLRHMTSLNDMLTALYLDAKERNDFALFSSTAERYFVKIQKLNCEIRTYLQKSEHRKPEITLDGLAAGITEQNRHGEVNFGPAVGNEIW